MGNSTFALIDEGIEPYDDKEPMQIVVEVVNDDLRPNIPVEYNNNILLPLMRDCWAVDPESRPSFEKIVKRLEVICNDNELDEISKLVMYGKNKQSNSRTVSVGM